MKLLSFTCLLGLIIGLLGCGNNKSTTNDNGQCSHVEKVADTCRFIRGKLFKGYNHSSVPLRDFLCCANQVTHLYLDADSLSTKDLEYLKRFKNIRSIHLNNFENVPEKIATFDKLEKISIISEKQNVTVIPRSFSRLKGIKTLYLNTSVFPKGLENLPKVDKVNITFISVKDAQNYFPPSVSLPQVKSLEIDNAQTIPKNIHIFSELKSLKLLPHPSKAQKFIVPSYIDQMDQLEELQIGATYNSEGYWIIDSLPASVGKLKKLRKLKLELCSYLPTSLSNLSKLSHLSITNTANQKIKNLGSILNKIKKLSVLEIYGGSIFSEKEITNALAKLEKLDTLILKTKNIPSDVFKVKSLQYLYIDHMGSSQNILSQISQPSSIKCLEIFRTHTNSIPDNIRYLKNLKILKITYGKLKKVSDKIGQLTYLEKVDFSHNPELKQLPESIKKIKNINLDYTPARPGE